MPTLAQITANPRGARFYRADLHIHSYGASHDVTDASTIPVAIIQAAKADGLAVISITDHNEINNLEAAIATSKDSDVLLIPGVELSTPQGHLLCYLPNLDALQKFYGRLEIVERGTHNSRCQNALLDCLGHLGQLGGFGILAHVDGDAGFERATPVFRRTRSMCSATSPSLASS